MKEQAHRMLQQSPLAALREHIANVESKGKAFKRVAYDQQGTVILPRAEALRLARREVARRVRRNKAVARYLRECEANPPVTGGSPLNLGRWVGAAGPGFQAVFGYSDNDPFRVAPWFMSLDLESQRICLLLVAHALESE